MLDKYNDWSKQPLDYNFNLVFSLVIVIYFVSVMFDFCLTYITFTLSPDGFFKYELSFIIKNAFSGDAFFCMMVVAGIAVPLIIVYSLNAYFVKHHGWSINSIRVVLFSIYFLSGMHIYGGFTNFFHLINLKV